MSPSNLYSTIMVMNHVGIQFNRTQNLYVNTKSRLCLFCYSISVLLFVYYFVNNIVTYLELFLVPIAVFFLYYWELEKLEKKW